MMTTLSMHAHARANERLHACTRKPALLHHKYDMFPMQPSRKGSVPTVMGPDFRKRLVEMVGKGNVDSAVKALTHKQDTSDIKTALLAMDQEGHGDDARVILAWSCSFVLNCPCGCP